MLLLELALIRWLGANVVHLSYFSNFVLLGSFLGIGLGFLVSRKSWSVVPVAMPLLALLVTAVLVFPVTIQRQGSDVIYFTAMSVAGPPAWLALPVIFLLVAVILAGPAEMVGRCFGQLEPLTAYRYDLIGSLLGIGVSLLGLALTLPDSVPAITAGLLVFTAGFFATHSVASAWVSARAPGRRGQASAMYLLAYYLGSSAFGALIGLAYQAAGWPAAATAVAVLFVLGALTVPSESGRA